MYEGGVFSFAFLDVALQMCLDMCRAQELDQVLVDGCEGIACGDGCGAGGLALAEVVAEEVLAGGHFLVWGVESGVVCVEGCVKLGEWAY